jgi:hypothetical protein
LKLVVTPISGFPWSRNPKSLQETVTAGEAFPVPNWTLYFPWVSTPMLIPSMVFPRMLTLTSASPERFFPNM